MKASKINIIQGGRLHLVLILKQMEQMELIVKLELELIYGSLVQ
jgi:hypothetical protein